MKSQVKKKQNLNFASFFLPLFPILSAYSYSFTLLDLGVTVLTIYCLWKFIKKKYVKINLYCLLFLIYVICSELVMVGTGKTNHTNAIGQILRVFLFTVFIGILSEEIHLDAMYKWIKIVSTVWIIGMVIQAFQIFVLGQSVNPLQILPVQNYNNWALACRRPLSFFVEPQAYASYFAVVILLNLKYKDYLFAIFATVSVGLSGSTLGIAEIMIIWLIFIIYNKNINLRRKVGISILIILFLIAYFNLDVFSTGSEKLLAVGTTYSDYTRIFQAFDIYVQLPIINKIVGIGYGAVSNFVKSNNLVMGWNGNTIISQYMTSGFGVLVEFGIVGAIFYYLFYFSKIRRAKENYIAMTLVVIIGITIITTTFFFNTYYLFYYVVFENLVQSDDRIKCFVLGKIWRNSYENISY